MMRFKGRRRFRVSGEEGYELVEELRGLLLGNEVATAADNRCLHAWSGRPKGVTQPGSDCELAADGQYRYVQVPSGVTPLPVDLTVCQQRPETRSSPHPTAAPTRAACSPRC